MQYEGVPLIEATVREGFCYGAITPIGVNAERGTGFLQGPDGSRAGLQWEVSHDGPYIALVERPGADHWGVYRVGFSRPVRTVDDLNANLAELLPKLKILYTRARVQ